MTQPLYEQLYRHILDSIKSGGLKPGDRVPSEKELAEQFGVSRITSKTALEKLAKAGVLDRVQGRGSFVARQLPNLHQLDFQREAATAGQSEASHDSRLVGLILPEFTDSYGTGIVHAVESACSSRGMHLIIKRTLGKQSAEEAYVRQLVEIGVEGLLVFPVHGEHYNPSIVRLVLDRFPLVLVDRYFKRLPSYSVCTDNKNGAKELTNYLLDRGHREIAFISSPAQNTSSIEDRTDGFVEAFVERELMVNPSYIISDIKSTLPSMRNAENVAADQDRILQFLERHPNVTAFVACEYNIAVLIRQALGSIGRRVPEDYSLVCFDSRYSFFNSPQFTHAMQDQEQMGTLAVDLLVEQMQGRVVPEHRYTPTRIVEGGSVHSPRTASESA